MAELAKQGLVEPVGNHLEDQWQPVLAQRPAWHGQRRVARVVLQRSSAAQLDLAQLNLAQAQLLSHPRHRELHRVRRPAIRLGVEQQLARVRSQILERRRAGGWANQHVEPVVGEHRVDATLRHHKEEMQLSGRLALSD